MTHWHSLSSSPFSIHKRTTYYNKFSWEEKFNKICRIDSLQEFVGWDLSVHRSHVDLLLNYYRVLNFQVQQEYAHVLQLSHGPFLLEKKKKMKQTEMKGKFFKMYSIQLLLYNSLLVNPWKHTWRVKSMLSYFVYVAIKDTLWTFFFYSLWKYDWDIGWSLT